MNPSLFREELLHRNGIAVDSFVGCAWRAQPSFRTVDPEVDCHPHKKISARVLPVTLLAANS